MAELTLKDIKNALGVEDIKETLGNFEKNQKNQSNILSDLQTTIGAKLKQVDDHLAKLNGITDIYNLLSGQKVLPASDRANSFFHKMKDMPKSTAEKNEEREAGQARRAQEKAQPEKASKPEPKQVLPASVNSVISPAINQDKLVSAIAKADDKGKRIEGADTQYAREIINIEFTPKSKIVLEDVIAGGVTLLIDKLKPYFGELNADFKSLQAATTGALSGGRGGKGLGIMELIEGYLGANLGMRLLKGIKSGIWRFIKGTTAFIYDALVASVRGMGRYIKGIYNKHFAETIEDIGKVISRNFKQLTRVASLEGKYFTKTISDLSKEARLNIVERWGRVMKDLPNKTIGEFFKNLKDETLSGLKNLRTAFSEGKILKPFEDLFKNFGGKANLIFKDTISRIGNTFGKNKIFAKVINEFELLKSAFNDPKNIFGKAIASLEDDVNKLKGIKWDEFSKPIKDSKWLESIKNIGPRISSTFNELKNAKWLESIKNIGPRISSTFNTLSAVIKNSNWVKNINNDISAVKNELKAMGNIKIGSKIVNFIRGIGTSTSNAFNYIKNINWGDKFKSVTNGISSAWNRVSGPLKNIDWAKRLAPLKNAFDGSGRLFARLAANPAVQRAGAVIAPLSKTLGKLVSLPATLLFGSAINLKRANDFISKDKTLSGWQKTKYRTAAALGGIADVVPDTARALADLGTGTFNAVRGKGFKTENALSDWLNKKGVGAGGGMGVKLAKSMYESEIGEGTKKTKSDAVLADVIKERTQMAKSQGFRNYQEQDRAFDNWKKAGAQGDWMTMTPEEHQSWLKNKSIKAESSSEIPTSIKPASQEALPKMPVASAKPNEPGIGDVHGTIKEQNTLLINLIKVNKQTAENTTALIGTMKDAGSNVNVTNVTNNPTTYSNNPVSNTSYRASAMQPGYGR
jgi:hypothetical protein